MEPNYITKLEEVLTQVANHMGNLMPITDFLETLPLDGDLSLFIQPIEKCIQHHAIRKHASSMPFSLKTIP